MGHVQNRILTTAAKASTVARSTLPQFPPKDALFTRRKLPSTAFVPETWASIQPPPPSALSAFAHRIGLPSVLDTNEIILQACTHPSFLRPYRRQYPDAPAPETNAQLAPLGNALMGLFASEYLHAKYPYLPTRVLKAAVTAHVGPLTCASVAQEMGATPLLRWHRTVRALPKTPTDPGLLHSDAMASIPRSIAALIYQRRSLLSARQFVHSYFLSRQVDLRAMLKFSNPKKALLEMVDKFGRERPKSRLLKETGRFTNSPVFVVGIYSGADQLGEGFGSSLRMAEYRAAEDALQRVYLTRTPDHLIQLPTSTFPVGLGDVFRTDAPEGKYTAPSLVMSEIMYLSSGKRKPLRIYGVETGKEQTPA
ncbi:ribonuclease III domain-containing protein [Crucibulum laeve]|uniref:Large ribosomal subunit protein mL44 n=1 Tax=Crucibulum laeve TaxID=68775 RepID=A0A5C3LJ20_9AGAR|nr:ribonuclease III domain-containing protein [Crucibulum laeve]